MNSSINYPIFSYNNESIVLIPGSRFTKKDLISRLHQMDIDASNIQDKNTLVNLYESSLQNHQNKLKIFDRLRKDTELLNSKLGLSQRQSIQASNMNTMSNNSKNKIINISSNVQPFNPNNSRVQEINIVKESRINRDENLHNPLISSNANQENKKTASFGQSTLVLKNSYNQSIIDSGNFENNYNNNNQNNINNSRRFTNNSNINNNSYYNNNSSHVNYQNQRQYDNSTINMNDNRNNMNNNNILNKSNISNLNKSKAYNQHYQEEEINTDINESNNYNNNKNNNRYFQENFSRNQKNNSIQPSQYQENSQSMQRSGNNNYGNSTQYQENNESMFRSGNNNINSINNNMNNTNYYNFQDTNQNQNPNRMYVESQGQPILSAGEEEQISNNRLYKRDLDEESNFSIYSTFKNSPLFKNCNEICFNVFIGIIIICFAIGTLSLVMNFWESIINFFSEFFNLLTDPRRLIVDGIFGFISSVFFGSIEYFYITIPLIILIIILIIYIYNYNIKKKCKKIYKKIYDDLINGNTGSENNIIYEEEMYRRYAQSLGITQKEFEKKYLPMLRKMRRKDSKMKTGCERNNNGKELTYWFLNN